MSESPPSPDLGRHQTVHATIKGVILVKVIRRFFVIISCLALTTMWLQAQPGASVLAAAQGPRHDIAFNEIAYRGTEASANDEWIELKNQGDQGVNLSGWKLMISEKEIKLKGQIEPQGYFLLERTDDQTVPSVKADLIYTGAMSDDGEVLKLIDGLGQIVDQVSKWVVIKDRSTMARGEDGDWKIGKGTPKAENAFSISREPSGRIEKSLVPPDPRDSSTRLSTGSVGMENKKDPTPVTSNHSVGILISRFLANPKGKDSEQEWIELSNDSDTSLDLRGFKLDNRDGGSKPYALNFILQPHKAAKLFSKETKITLRNMGDQVRVLSPSGTVVDSLEYETELGEGVIMLREDFSFDPITAEVTEVVDGDTMEVSYKGKREKVRLIGVDTPETVHPEKPEQYFGREASHYTKTRLIGKTVRLEFDHERRDEYGRLLAYLFLDSKLFNAELIEEGYGKAYLQYPFQYFQEFSELEKKAKELGKGMWKKSTESPLPFPSPLRNILEKIRQMLRALFDRKTSSTEPIEVLAIFLGLGGIGTLIRAYRPETSKKDDSEEHERWL